MSATSHGTSLSAGLIEQPGATFTVTRMGFDTGRRQFKCSRSIAAASIPGKGTPDDVFASMYVDIAVMTFNRAGIAVIDVNYLGLMAFDGVKEDEVSYSVSKSADPQKIITTAAELETYALSEIIRPDVHHKYVSESFPDTTIGDYINPPAFADKLPSEEFNLPNSTYKIVFTAAFQGWRLVNREVRKAGPLFEISDGYSYTYVAASAVITLT